MNLRSAPATLAVGTLGLILLAGLGWVVLLGPTVGAISDNGEARTEAQDRNTIMSLQLAQLRRQADDLPTTDALARRLDTMWPPTADQPGFFAQVSAAATDAGIAPDDITALSPSVPVLLGADDGAGTPPAEGTEASTSAVAVQSVSIGVVGSFDELTSLLANLEQMPRAFLVGSVDVASSDEGMSLTLLGTTFVAPPLDPPADAPAETPPDS